jgi:hypothetical protein
LTPVFVTERHARPRALKALAVVGAVAALVSIRQNGC